MFIIGLAAALLSFSAMRLGAGPFGLIQLPIVVLVLGVFFLKESRLASLAAGLGLGLDLVSSYAFFSWTLIVAATTLAGWWISKTVLTNRSLPSLLLLGAAMRAAYFIFELGTSRLGEIAGGTVWYRVSGVRALGLAEAFGLEMLVLAACFFIYVRLRGERSRMLTHL
jgi:hypothetical protein